MISKYDFMSVSNNFQSNSKIDKERNSIRGTVYRECALIVLWCVTYYW
jgi:hypothetical protein